MKKIKIPKISLPKLSTILWIAFAIVILIEAAVLYKSIYLNLVYINKGEVAAPVGEMKINQEPLEELKAWISERENGILPSYVLDQGKVGRENPFLEY